jgi:plastocyanin
MKPVRMRHPAFALVLLLAALVVAACSKSSAPTAPNGGGGGGGTTSGGGGASFNLGPFARGQSAEVLFPGEGAFGYHCIPHRSMGMVGTVQVDAGGADSAVVQIGATGFSFIPSTAHIKPGGHVRWVNASGFTNHTVTSD